jgi:hypothetical protein
VYFVTKKCNFFDDGIWSRSPWELGTFYSSSVASSTRMTMPLLRLDVRCLDSLVN